MIRQIGALWMRTATLLAAAALIWISVGTTAARATPHGGYIVVDMESGAILDHYRSQVQLRPASLTKMMTVYLAFEALEDGRLDWDQTLTVSAHAASMQGQELRLRRGDQITVGEAVLATAIYSANDAAVALAEAIAGTEAEFVRRMNAKARMLGLQETTFGTASGLFASEQFTTPRDMAVLARRLYFDFPDRYEIFGRTGFEYRGRRRGSTNGLLRRHGVDGVKTGYTRRAGFNLAASAERDGRRVLVVLMGGQTSRARNNAVLALLDDGFERLRRLETSGQLFAETSLPDQPGGPLQAPTPTMRAAPAGHGAIETATASPAGAPAPADAVEIASAVADTLVERVGGHTAEGGGPTPDWSVQIGAFVERSRAETLLRDVLFRYSDDVSGAFQSIVPVQRRLGGSVRTFYRARFTGMTHHDAKTLCDRMRARNAPCLIVSPDGWGG